MTLVDTNVLLDIATDDPAFADWSPAQLEAASLHGSLLINDVIYAELSVRYDRIERLDEFVDRAGLHHEAMPVAALFWPARPSGPIGRLVGLEPACSLTSSSASTRRCEVTPS